MRIPFAKAHAYGNDFIYIEAASADGAPAATLARALCDRHRGIGADGLILFTRTPAGAAMELRNADGGRAEVSGNGVRALAALLLQDDEGGEAHVTIETAAGAKQLTRVGGSAGRPTFRARMGLPADLRQMSISAAGEALSIAVMDFGNPQSVVIGPLPDRVRFTALGAALERHPLFPEGTNVEFASVESAATVRILIWERGVGPTESSGTGSCAALVAAAAYGGAAREADVIAPGGSQRVEWLDDSVYLTGWAELLFSGTWVGQISPTT